MADHYDPATPLSGSKDYMHLKFAATEGIPKDVHFVLIESVAEHIIDTLFLQDDRIEAVEVKIVKLAIAEEGEQIGITIRPARRWRKCRAACPRRWWRGGGRRTGG